MQAQVPDVEMAGRVVSAFLDGVPIHLFSRAVEVIEVPPASGSKTRQYRVLPDSQHIEYIAYDDGQTDHPGAHGWAWIDAAATRREVTPTTIVYHFTTGPGPAFLREG